MTERARWPIVLGGAGTVAAAAVLAPWVRGMGTPVPDTIDVAEDQLAQSGVPIQVAATGASGWLGAVLLLAAVMLMAIALWSVSPVYRAVPASYSAIGAALIGCTLTVYYLVDEGWRRSAFGSAVDLQTDSVELSWWPWVALAGFGVACAAALMTVPADAVRRGPESNLDTRLSECPTIRNVVPINPEEAP